MSVKVLLVEDDNNLREIFEMRLQAEGYNTVTAADGEEALVIAVKEKPDLVIADVMMPKLSGFEMVENMRAVPELANTRVVMMTALGQAEDRARGEKLGVVKYLVKSQVTLEDFVRVIREVMPPDQNGSAPAAANSDEPAQPAPTEASEPENNNQAESEKPMQDDNQQANSPAPDAGAAPVDPAAPAADANPISGAPTPDLNAPAAPNGDATGAQTAAEESSAVQGQINDFTNGTAPAAPASPAVDTPADPAADAGAPAGDAGASAAPAADNGDAPDVPVSSPPVSEPGTDSNNPPAEGGEQPTANPL